MFNLLTNIFCVADSNNNKGYLDITYPNKQLQGRHNKKQRIEYNASFLQWQTQ